MMVKANLTSQRRRLRLAAWCPLLVAVLGLSCAGAQEPVGPGKWELALLTGRYPGYGVLEIVMTDGKPAAYVDGGPVGGFELDGNRVRFDLDWTDGGDTLHIWEVSGALAGSMLRGEIREKGEQKGTWSAEPWAEHSEAGATPKPIDLSGIWVSLSRGTHKDSFDLTPEGQALQDAYDPTLDDPHLRCVTGGVIRMEDGPFPTQIIELEDELVVLYEYFHQVRHIWMDGRDFPEGIEDANLHMGYSIGHWEGSTLVVETRGMKPTVWDAKGPPVSPAAVLIERKYLDTQGRLHGDYTLRDPANFKRPVYRHEYWERRKDAEIEESSCDPHSFYRSLDLEGRLEEYWGRSGNRY